MTPRHIAYIVIPKKRTYDATENVCYNTLYNYLIVNEKRKISYHDDYFEVEMRGKIKQISDGMWTSTKIKKTRLIPFEIVIEICTGIFNNYGTTYHYYQGILHSDDFPAIEDSHGTKKWFNYGTKIKEEHLLDYSPKLLPPPPIDLELAKILQEYYQ